MHLFVDKLKTVLNSPKYPLGHLTRHTLSVLVLSEAKVNK
jgi:hypothetical protein